MKIGNFHRLRATIIVSRLAERARFELAVSCPTLVFKTSTINHSVTSPTNKDYNILVTVCYTAYTKPIMRTTQRKGDSAVAQAIATFTKLDWDVSIPLTESAAYDLVVDDNSGLHRVQVRYTSSGEVDLRRIHSNSLGYVVKKTKENAYDWIYILDLNGSEYLIKECLHGRRSIKPTQEFLLKNL